MPKALKIALVIVLLAILVIAGLLAYVLVAVNPNDYKAQIEEAARKQGIALDMEGEIGWSFYPGLGLAIGATRVSSEQHQLRPSSLASAELSLAWAPLLSKQIVINALTIKGADLHLDQLGQAAALAGAPAADGGASEAPSGAGFSLAVNRLELNDSAITLYDAEGGTTVIRDINLSTLGLDASGGTSPITLGFQYPLEDRVITISAEGDIGYAQQTGQLRIPQLAITADNLLAEPLTLNLTGSADLNADTLSLELLDSGGAGLTLAGTVDASGLTDALAFDSRFSLASQDLRKTLGALTGKSPATAHEDALKTLELTVEVTGQDNLFNLDTLELALDDTRLTGEGTLQLAETRNLQLALKGNHINLDHYQSPQPATDSPGAESATEANTALLAPLAAMVALVDGGTASIDLALDSLVLAGSEFSGPQARIDVQGDSVHLAPLRFGIYDGKVDTTVSANLGDQPPRLTFSLNVADVDIDQAQRQWSENSHVRGRLTMTLQGTTLGDSGDDLFDNLAATGNLAITQLHLAAVNLEQSYCELAQLVEKNPPRQEPWPEGTDLEPLASQFAMEGRTIRLQNYITGVGNLNIRGQGAIRLDREDFDIDVIANLRGERTSENGCAIKSKSIRNRDIPLRCRDNFAEAGATSCKPDSDFVKTLLQNQLLDRLVPPSEDGEEKPLEGLLRGLLNR